MQEQYGYIVDELADKGWVAIPEFISLDIVKLMLDEQKELIEQGKFRDAGVGRGENFQVRPEIRGDKVMWLNNDNLSALQKVYLQKVEELRLMCNQELYLGLNSFECHFSQYPPNSFYKKHIDQFKETRHRVISCLLYLNFDWNEEFGGQLRIYTPEDDPDKFIDIIPHAGTFVCFRSDDIPHEVLPTYKERFSVTGWLRR
ncbi:MAG: 2OG-Fe(II) oxygenase [Bacteroidota bacterium]|nr:2OG-Fe(II) oxygenase [Bacteroidota bacterium]